MKIYKNETGRALASKKANFGWIETTPGKRVKVPLVYGILSHSHDPGRGGYSLF